MEKIIELKTIYDYGENERNIYSSIVGYYSSYDTAIKQMDRLYNKDKRYIMFLTEEYKIDVISEYSDNYEAWVCVRQYKYIDGEGMVMTHETVRDFKGHVTDKYSYKPGDVIEYMDSHDMINIAIVGYTPITIEEVKKRNITVDDSDDSYLVYDLGKGDTHDHISSCLIIGYADVSPEIYKQYQDKLKERYEQNKKGD